MSDVHVILIRDQAENVIRFLGCLSPFDVDRVMNRRSPDGYMLLSYHDHVEITKDLRELFDVLRRDL